VFAHGPYSLLDLDSAWDILVSPPNPKVVTTIDSVVASALGSIVLTYCYPITLVVTDLISAVVELLGRDMNRLVVEAREALEPVEPWDEG
jgi:hypothetical protein